MSFPWSEKTLKSTPVGADEVMLIDSEDTDPETINKRARLDTIPSSGQTNTASNVGSGQGIFKQKAGVDLEFKSLIGQSDKITLTGNTDDVTFTIGSDVVTIDKINTYEDFAQIFADDKLQIQNPAASFVYTIAGSTIAADRTITFPLLTANDIFVTQAFTQTLTNKTINGNNNTISNIAVSSLANGTDGQLITWDSIGSPTTVATGNDGQILTSNGPGAAPTFQNIPSQFPVVDTTPIVEGSVDSTKQLRFEIDGFTTATLRVITPPDADITLVDTSDGTISNSNVNGSAAIAYSKLATLATGSIVFGNGGIAVGGAMSGDATIDNTGAITIASNFATSSDNLSFFASTTSSQLAGVISDETGAGALVFGTSPTLATPVISTITNTGTLTLPISTDTLVGRATTDTLTNKTFDANATGNSLSNVDVADLANGTDGQLITWDSSGAPDVVATGTSGQILTSNGSGAAPTFQEPTLPSDPTFVTVTIENQGTGDDPLLSSNNVDKSLNLIGNLEMLSGCIDLTEILEPLDPSSNIGRIYELDYGGISTPFHRDTLGTITNLLSGEAQGLITIHNQLQLEQELTTDLLIPDGEHIGIVIADSFTLTKPFKIGNGSSLKISSPVPATQLLYTGTGAMFQNDNPANPIQALIVDNIRLIGDTTNTLFDLNIFAFAINSIQCINFLDLGTIDTPQGVVVDNSLFQNNTKGFKLVEPLGAQFSAVTAIQTSASDFTFITVLSDTASSTNLSLDGVQLVSQFSGDALVFADPNTPTTGNSYAFQNCSVGASDLYQQGVDIAINSIANNGSGKCRYTTASAHNLVTDQAVVKSGFVTQTVLNVTSLITAIPTTTTFDTDEDFVATDTGSMTEQSLEQDSVIVNAFANPGQPNSMIFGGFFVTEQDLAITSGTFADITFGTALDSLDIEERFILNDTANGEVVYTGLSDADVKIEFIIPVDGDADNTTASYEIKFLIDKGSGYVDISQSPTSLFSVNTGSDAFTSIISATIKVSNGDKLKLQALRSTGSRADILVKNTRMEITGVR